MTRLVYFDTSALVKLLVEEQGSAEARSLFEAAEQAATHLIAYVEVRSALARLRREGRIAAADIRAVRADLDRLWPQLMTLDLPPATIRDAGDLADRYDLAGYDAVHLATALTIHAALGEPLLLAAWDRRLNRAAAAAGLTTIPSAPH